MFFDSPKENYSANKGRQNIASVNRHNFSKRVSGQKIDIIKIDYKCEECFNDKFFSYFYSNKLKCTRCKKIIYKK